MGDRVRDLLQLAAMAPSGDNSQPWRFVVDRTTVHIYNIPGRDNPYLNFDQSGSYIAHGALVENILIAAPHFGYRADLSLFPGADLVATVTLVEDTLTHRSPLFVCIGNRHTNRRPYQERPLMRNQAAYVTDAAADVGHGRIILVDDKRKKELAARAASATEIVILENPMLHDYLFRDIVWTAKEEQKIRSGLYIDTMEFNAMQKFLFKAARFSAVMVVAKMVRFPHFIAREDATLYSSGAALGLLTIPGDTPRDFLMAGRVFQRMWLKATDLGLYVQPLAATLFFARRLLAGRAGDLSVRHRDLIERAYGDIAEAFGIGNAVAAMMFRIGYAEPPSAKTSRKRITLERTTL